MSRCPHKLACLPVRAPDQRNRLLMPLHSSFPLLSLFIFPLFSCSLFLISFKIFYLFVFCGINGLCCCSQGSPNTLRGERGCSLPVQGRGLLIAGFSLKGILGFRAWASVAVSRSVVAQCGQGKPRRQVESSWTRD